MEKEMLDVHYRKAISLSSLEDVMTMAKVIAWSEFEKFKLPNPELRDYQ
jgi:hypothetical protein